MLDFTTLRTSNLQTIAAQMNNGVSEEELITMCKDDLFNGTLRWFIHAGDDSWMFVEEAKLEQLLLDLIRIIQA